jgi:hypothetical protein
MEIKRGLVSQARSACASSAQACWAITAPVRNSIRVLRPEVDQHRNVVVLDMRRKAFGRSWKRPPGEDRLVAAVAFRLVVVLVLRTRFTLLQ